MTIERGKEWGQPVLVPSDVVVVHNDAHLAHMSTTQSCVVTGGDIWHALGEPEIRPIGTEAMEVHIDALEVTIHVNGTQQQLLASSSVEVGEWWSRAHPFRRQRFIACTNFGEIRKRQLAPRAHPNDGFVDVMSIDSNMSIRQRLLSLQKSRSGTHIPHPNISITRSQNFTITRTNNKEKLRIDGMLIRHWDSINIVVRPDYWNVIV